MKKMQFGKRIINVPTTFEELSNKQIIRWADLVSANLTITQFNVLMFLNLVNDNRMKWFFFKNEYLIPIMDKVTFGVFNWKVQKFDNEAFHEATLICEAFHDQHKMPFQNPVSYLGSISNILIGHDTLFNNLCFKQFRKAEEYFAKYLDTKDEYALNHLIATLYREENMDLALSLSTKQILKRVKRIGNIDRAYKMAIFNNYFVNRMAITQVYKFLYKQDGKTTNAKLNPHKIKLDLEKSVRAVAGNVNQLEDTDLKPAHDVLAYLNDEAEQAQKILDQQKSQ